MMKRVYYILASIVLIAASFLIGTKTGRYLSSVERENLYPFKLRDVWTNNQPTCDDYYSLTKREKPILIDIVKDTKNQIYFKVVSLPSKVEEGKLIYSILNSDQEQFVDELWLDCK
jgi:hypothetical protein